MKRSNQKKKFFSHLNTFFGCQTNMSQQQQQLQGFHTRKHQIVSSLVEFVDPERRDKSPKGFIDAPILDLMHVINQHPDYYTTSSCSGRVAVYCEGLEKDVDINDPDAIEKTTKGGIWLYVSHDPIPMPKENLEAWIVQLLFGNQSDKVEFSSDRPDDILSRQLIYFKFEPLVKALLTERLDFILTFRIDFTHWSL